MWPWLLQTGSALCTPAVVIPGQGGVLYPGLNWSCKVALVTCGEGQFPSNLNVRIGFSRLIQCVQECLSEQPVRHTGWQGGGRSFLAHGNGGWNIRDWAWGKG